MSDLTRSVWPEIAPFLPPPSVVIERMMEEPTVAEIVAAHAAHHAENVRLVFDGHERHGVVCWDCRVIQTTSRREA